MADQSTMARLHEDQTYYGVELKELPPSWMLDEIKEMYGPADSNRWLVQGRTIYFVSSADHMLFLIKYS